LHHIRLKMLKNFTKWIKIGKNFNQNTLTFKSLNNSSNHQINRCYASCNNISSNNNVLESTEIKKLSKNLELLITSKPEYKSLSDKILQSKLQTCLFEKDKKNLQRKLNFKLAWIVLAIKRMISAFECNYLDDTAKLDLIKEIVINELKRNEKDLDSKLDVLDLLGFDSNEADEDEELLYQLDLENNQKEHDFDTFLKENGKNLSNLGTNSYGQPLTDYCEDIQQSVDQEILNKITDLRNDFPEIDKHIKKLKFIVISDWFSEYQERFLESKCDEFDFGWENEDGDPEWICP